MAQKTYTLHLAKPDIAKWADILSENAGEKLKHRRTQSVPIEGFADGAHLYVFTGDDKPPAWSEDLRRHFGIKRITTNSSCALLAFKRDDRIFVASFSFGWMYLNQDNFEGDFGLRVALNSLDEKKLNRLERANLGDALRGISLSPFQRDFQSFGTDDALDLVRKISGKTHESSSSSSMTGARSLKISGEFNLDELPELATEAAKAFASEKYKESSFRVIDFVSPVMDQRLENTLDELAVEAIKSGSDSFELGLPLNYEDDGVAFKFQGPGLAKRFPDLLMRHYVESLGPKLLEIRLETLLSHRVVAVYDSNDKPDRHWSIRSALIGSIAYDGGLFAINEGEWYRVDEAFKIDIERSFQEVVHGWKVQPEPLKKVYDSDSNGRYERENEYNRRIAADLGLICLDGQLLQISGIERSSFEACDLLDIRGRRFIHVKKSSRRSNVLSHFFKQGSNSAQNFKRFPSVWKELESVIRDPSLRAELSRQRESGQPWSVEFWIADTPRENGEFNIPFFSRISLRDELRNLQAMQYAVKIRFIGLMADQVRNSKKEL